METPSPIAGRLNQLSLLHRIYIHRAAAKHGMHFGQLPILELLAKQGSCTQRELADILHVSPPSITNSVKRMQKAGLLEKTVDSDDLRYNNITITEEGRKYAAQCRKLFDQVDKQMVEGFSPEELAQFTNFLQRMIDNLAQDDLKKASFFSLLATDEKLHRHPGRKEPSS